MNGCLLVTGKVKFINEINVKIFYENVFFTSGKSPNTDGC